MSLEEWLANRWLTRFQLTDLERQKLLLAAERELRDAKLDLSPGSRFAIAYNAALRLCTVALATAGFRATRDQKHYRTIAALPLVLGPDVQELAAFLDTCRGKRHELTYEASDAVSHEEADALVEAAEELMARIRR
jgi:uncharacterized protein (UPF0332 family)